MHSHICTHTCKHPFLDFDRINIFQYNKYIFTKTFKIVESLLETLILPLGAKSDITVGKRPLRTQRLSDCKAQLPYVLSNVTVTLTWPVHSAQDQCHSCTLLHIEYGLLLTLTLMWYKSVEIPKFPGLFSLSSHTLKHWLRGPFKCTPRCGLGAKMKASIVLEERLI